MHNHDTRFIKEDPWRVLRIMGEFVESLEPLSPVGPRSKRLGKINKL